MLPSDVPTSNLISTARLAESLTSPDLVVADGSWYLPTQKRDAAAEYRAGHIPGAVFFDIDAIVDPSSGLPHMLPDPKAFAEAAGKLGIGDGTQVVVYDGAGLFSAPRVWWTLKAFGVANVAVLDGGLPQWKAEGRPLDAGSVTPAPRRFTPRFERSAVADLTQVRQALESGGAQVVDARPAERFRGEAPEPRPGVRAGHMPGSLSLPFSAVIAEGRLKPANNLIDAFTDAGIDLERPVITSCGSGVSAAILALALAEAGKQPALYDGSWTEWGSRADLPIATGDAKRS